MTYPVLRFRGCLLLLEPLIFEFVSPNMDSFYRSFGVNPGRSGYDLCIETGDLVDKTRKQLTDLSKGGDPDRLCFSYS